MYNYKRNSVVFIHWFKSEFLNSKDIPDENLGFTFQQWMSRQVQRGTLGL